MGKEFSPDDIVGKQFGKLTVLENVGKKNHKYYYSCLCDCGNISVVRRDALITGNTSSCGKCFRIEREGDYYRYTFPNGDSFVFDECDLELVSSRKWHLSRGYPCCAWDGNSSVLSRMILNPPKDFFIDHIDGDTRNNRRSNLRIVSKNQNMQNMRIKRINKTGYKGVCYTRNHKRFEASIHLNGKTLHLGSFDTREDAALAYDEAARKYHGEYACVNFPQEGERGCREAV